MLNIIRLSFLVPALLFGQELFLNNNTVEITADGDLEYAFAHFVGSADSVSYTPTITQNVYTKLIPSMVSHEADHITFAADSLTINSGYDGDYFILISVRLSGANANDAWRIKVYKNASSFPSSVGQFIFRTTTGGYTDTKFYMWYLPDLVAGDDVSFYITNLSASRNPTIQDMKIYMEKKPET